MKFKSTNFPKVKYDKKVTRQLEGALDLIMGEVRKTTCVSCGKELTFDKAEMYDHYAGRGLVAGVPKQWISFHCYECNYDSSLTKLILNRG
jgi:hypothetical protein